MPDQGGRLTDSDRRILDKWIAEHPPGGMKCPVCQSEKKWLVTPQLVSPIPINEVGKQMMVYPTSHTTSLFLTCRTCGANTILSAQAVGII